VSIEREMTPNERDGAPYWVNIDEGRYLQIERFDEGYGRDGGDSDDDGSGRPFRGVDR
jgi:hypothetical protein